MEVKQDLQQRIPIMRDRSPRDRVRTRLTDYPGNIFNPERFLLAHKWITMALFFESIALDIDDSDEWERGQECRKRYEDAMQVASSKVAYDWDDDGHYDQEESDAIFTNIELVR